MNSIIGGVWCAMRVCLDHYKLFSASITGVGFNNWGQWGVNCELGEVFMTGVIAGFTNCFRDHTNGFTLGNEQRLQARGLGVRMWNS